MIIFQQKKLDWNIIISNIIISSLDLFSHDLINFLSPQRSSS